MTAEALIQSLEQTLAQERQRLEDGRIFERIVASRKSLMCVLKGCLEKQRQEVERLKRNRPDHGFYYHLVSAESVDHGFREEAGLAFKIAVGELLLADLGLQIQWFDNKCNQAETHKDFLSGDLEVFS